MEKDKVKQVLENIKENLIEIEFKVDLINSKDDVRDVKEYIVEKLETNLLYLDYLLGRL